MILDDILRDKRFEVNSRKKRVPIDLLKKKCEMAPLPRPFSAAIKKSGGIAVISEIKKASPSKGQIVSNFDPVNIAKVYTEAGADALSVLTDEKYFEGNLEYLSIVKANTKLPVLRKDFIIESYQIYESKAAGADAVLIIAAALTDKEIKEMIELSFNMYLDVLVEVHNEKELNAVKDIQGVKIIGINNRDLKTFDIDIGVSEKLLSHIPNEVVKVSESGLVTLSDVKRVRDAGADAILVGESLMKSEDKGKMIKEFKIEKIKKR